MASTAQSLGLGALCVPSFPGITRSSLVWICVVVFFPEHRQGGDGKADNFSVLDFCPGFKLGLMCCW